MQIIILEDEELTAENLADTILQVEPTAKITARLYSVKEAISYFQQNNPPDLIFSDIQLGDGLSFEVFAAIGLDVPVIFCTAYDEYALNAFKSNGIDYILKPFSRVTVEASIGRFHNLRKKLSLFSYQQYETILKIFGDRPEPTPSAILVNVKEKIVPVKLNDIALFYLKHEIVHLHTFELKTFLLNKGTTLDELEKIYGPSFFRVNRQLLIGRKTIVDTSNYFSRKLTVNLSIPFSETVLVSKEKSASFLKWLTGI
jgi:two-component system response regulator LytT